MVPSAFDAMDYVSDNFGAAAIGVRDRSLGNLRRGGGKDEGGERRKDEIRAISALSTLTFHTPSQNITISGHPATNSVPNTKPPQPLILMSHAGAYVFSYFCAAVL